MAAIISISSDEEQPDEPTINPKKEIKIGPIICLDDDDEEKKCTVNNSKDIVIESDEDVICDDKNNVNSKIDGNHISKKVVLKLKRPIVDADTEKCDQGIKKIKIGSVSSITLAKKPNTIYNLDTDKEKSVVNTSENTDKKKSVANTSENTDKEKSVANTSENDVVEMFCGCKEMQIFINLCLSQINNDVTKNLFKSKVPLCKKLFDKVGSEYTQSDYFKDLLEDKITSSKTSSIIAISSFNDVYQHLKAQLQKTKITEGTTSKNEVIIAKLEHALRKVNKVIKKLEETEVNFDEEDDSNYIKMQRYRERAVKIYEKICKYKKEDARANYILYNRLDFSGSSYPEFNHAINKKFKNNSVFPTFYELERCLRKAAKDKNMNLSESAFSQEARDCFKSLGNLLQKRRKMDLLSVHSHYLVTIDDPAQEDAELNTKLDSNYKDANTKISEICEKYTKLQEAGEDPKLSSDSDDSKRASSTEDEAE